MKTFLHRAYNVCSSWELFNEELMRIKQLLVNNNFPNQIVDRTIKNFLARKFANSNTDSLQDETNRTEKPIVNTETCDDETAKLFYENQMTSSYKQEEAALRKNNSRRQTSRTSKIY